MKELGRSNRNKDLTINLQLKSRLELMRPARAARSRPRGKVGGHGRPCRLARVLPAPPPVDRDHDDSDAAQPATSPRRHPPPPQESQQSQPHAQPSTMPPVVDLKQWLNDPVLANKADRSMSYALKLLDLGLGASEMEMEMRYSRQLAREYHPDKTTMR